MQMIIASFRLDKFQAEIILPWRKCRIRSHPVDDHLQYDSERHADNSDYDGGDPCPSFRGIVLPECYHRRIILWRNNRKHLDLHER